MLQGLLADRVGGEDGVGRRGASVDVGAERAGQLRDARFDRLETLVDELARDEQSRKEHVDEQHDSE